MNVLYALLGSAVGAPLGMFLHAWLTAKRQMRSWRRILATYDLEGESD